MINTDVFVRRLADSLQELLSNKQLIWIASSSSTELILTFSEFSLCINFLSGVTLIRKEEPYSTIARLWHKQFHALHQQKVQRVTAHYGERMLLLEFENRESLVLLLRASQGMAVEKNSGIRFPVGKTVPAINDSQQHLRLDERDALHAYPPDDLPWYRHKDFLPIWNSDYWIQTAQIDPLKGLLYLEEDWRFNTICVFLPNKNGLPFLHIKNRAINLLEKESQFESHSAIEAFTWYSRKYLSLVSIEGMRKILLASLSKKLKRIEGQINHLNQELLEDKSEYWHHQADLVMAHLHVQPEAGGKLTVTDFLTQKPVSMIVDPEKPIKTATKWYKKARNTRMLQQEQKETLANLYQELDSTQKGLLELEEVTEFKELKQKFKQVHQKEHQSKDLKYRVYQVEGFRILVGKHAESNQEVLRVGHKDDLWFHARGYSGSHVLIQKAGKIPGKTVIQKAAALAAYFSRGKTAGLCPVQYTPRKHVRQAKGLEPGQVIVEKEEVILVEPGLPD